MPDAADPIKHVIVLALENRSFDHMLGACQEIKPDIDGATATPPRENSSDNAPYRQVPGAVRVLANDPHHETPHVLAQLTNAGGQPNAGFVQDYALSYPAMTVADRGEVMKYHALDNLPALHVLARNFLVCDKWFASVPGPTWTNRPFLTSGTSLGRVNMPEGVLDLNLHWYDQPTIFDRLNEVKKNWAIYYGDVPLSLLLVHQWEGGNRARYKPVSQFAQDVAAATNDTFPDFVFIEPAYMDPGANDDHPSHDVLAGEALIAHIYNTIRASDYLWRTTLLVVLFDEHGGFYDHVSPPAAIPPDHHQEEYTFNQLGVRVPAILVSPHVGNGVLHDQFDHTSLLKYLIDKWELGGLGERAAQAKSVAGAIGDNRRDDAPRSIPSLPTKLNQVPQLPRQPLNSHQNAIVALTHALESMAGEDPAIVAARSHQMLTGPQSQIDAAVDRVEAFLKRDAVELLRDAEGNMGRI